MAGTRACPSLSGDSQTELVDSIKQACAGAPMPAFPLGASLINVLQRSFQTVVGFNGHLYKNAYKVGMLLFLNQRQHLSKDVLTSGMALMTRMWHKG